MNDIIYSKEGVKMDFKTEIRMCIKLGEIQAYVTFLKIENKNSIEFSEDLLKLEKAIKELEKILLS